MDWRWEVSEFSDNLVKGLQEFADCEHEHLKCEKCGARSNLFGWMAFCNEYHDLQNQLAAAQEAAYAGWVGATGYPIAEWVYLYHPWLREYKPKATLKKGLPILGTVSDDGAVIWNGGDGP